MANIYMSKNIAYQKNVNAAYITIGYQCYNDEFASLILNIWLIDTCIYLGLNLSL